MEKQALDVQPVFMGSSDSMGFIQKWPHREERGRGYEKWWQKVT